MGFWFESPAINLMTFWIAATIAQPFPVPMKSSFHPFWGLTTCLLLASLNSQSASFILSNWLTALSTDYFSYLPLPVWGALSPSLSPDLRKGKDNRKEEQRKNATTEEKIGTWIKLELHIRLQDKWRRSDLPWPHTLIYHSTLSTVLTVVLCTSSLVINQTP